MKIAYIKWRDSAMYHGQDRSTADDLMVSEFESIGWYMGKTDDGGVVIYRDKIRDEQRSLIVIPKENIVKIKILKPMGY